MASKCILCRARQQPVQPLLSPVNSATAVESGHRRDVHTPLAVHRDSFLRTQVVGLREAGPVSLPVGPAAPAASHQPVQEVSGSCSLGPRSLS